MKCVTFGENEKDKQTNREMKKSWPILMYKGTGEDLRVELYGQKVQLLQRAHNNLNVMIVREEQHVWWREIMYMRPSLFRKPSH
jgi:hypothetical protein